MNDNSLKILRELQDSSSKIVLAGGVFDIIHPGHINTLNAAKKLGDTLVVVVATDKTTLKMKKRKPLHNAQLRQELVSSLSMVDLCIIGDEENIFKTVDLVKPQIIALGYDQTHQEKYITDGCREINLDVRVARLESPRPETSSSLIQKEYGKDIHDL
jgi:cytidyltransferase-like protein|tara:strand:- start:148 stop:621 length:474 start_codon:yes stop_codon:yes gene_type:complete